MSARALTGTATSALPPRGVVTTAAVPSSVPCAQVASMARALDFYLGLGCEVRRATDGWVLLGGGASFVLVGRTGPGYPGEFLPEDRTSGELPWVRLSTLDVRALRRRLLGDGVPTSVVLRPTHHSLGEIHVVDPDQRRVVIEQVRPGELRVVGAPTNSARSTAASSSSRRRGCSPSGDS